VAALAGLLAIALIGPAMSGCSRAKPKSAPDAPPLEMPAPPPREMEPTETEPPAPVPLPQEPARSTPPRVRPAPPREPARSNEPRPEAPRPEQPAVVESPKIEEPKPSPPTILQTTPAQADGEVEKSIRSTMTRASGDLSRIDYRALNADARNQYDTAKGFIRQAEAAIARKNLDFAKTLADKAATIAAQLGGK
jgi:outer membrane biosynthesis protein TonB